MSDITLCPAPAEPHPACEPPRCPDCLGNRMWCHDADGWKPACMACMLAAGARFITA